MTKADFGVCESCPAGYYGLTIDTANYGVACYKCEHGKYSTAGATECSTCDAANINLTYSMNGKT